MFRYADKMFSLSYEMLDIVNYRKESQILFDVSIADALSKRLASRVLLSVIPNDGSIHLRCFQIDPRAAAGTTERAQARHDPLRLPGGLQPACRPAFQAVGGCGVSFFCKGTAARKAFFLPVSRSANCSSLSRRTAMGRQLTQWFEQQGISPQHPGNSTAALMKAFGFFNQGIFMAPTIYREEILEGGSGADRRPRI